MTSIDSLGAVFGNVNRLKLVRFFVLNEGRAYTAEELAERAGITLRAAKAELPSLLRARFIRKKQEKRIEKKGKKERARTAVVLSLNPSHPQRGTLKQFFTAAAPIAPSAIVSKLGQTPRLKLVVASGVFIDNPETRLDLLVVGDKVDKQALDKSVRGLERAVGRELRYAFLETPDFTYRASILDKLIRDVLDYPHQKLLDRLGR